MARIDLKHVHRVRRRLADGSHREHHYAWRGGPKFWSSDTDVQKHSPEYLAAFAVCVARPAPDALMAVKMVDAYLDSAEFLKLADRTKADYRKWGLRLAKAFENDPAAIFEEPASRGEVNDWRQQWAHSPKQFDYAGTVATVILNWARDNSKIREHHCDRLKKVYEVDRAEIVWTPTDREAIDSIAPNWVRRILCVACETGLRPADLIKLTKSSVEHTPSGRRLRVRTNKRGRRAHIPVTPELAKVIDATPRDRLLILVNASGKQLTEHRASEGLRQWRDKAELSRDLRLQDCRGTATTRLLIVGLSLAEVADHMGWSIRHAANVIEHYARVSPSETDAVLVKLAQAKGGGQ